MSRLVRRISDDGDPGFALRTTLIIFAATQSLSPAISYGKVYVRRQSVMMAESTGSGSPSLQEAYS